jgi:hypothetical protein
MKSYNLHRHSRCELVLEVPSHVEEGEKETGFGKWTLSVRVQSWL